MKQIRFLCAVLAVSVLSLTGCADIKNLSEEQENEIAEYAAGVLLQNSDKYPYRLITKEEKEVTETPTPMPAAPTKTSAAAQASDAPQESQPEQTKDAPEDTKKEVSLDDLYHLKGVSISYTSYRLTDKYGSSQIRAEQGKKLLVAEFSLKNNSGAKKRVKLIDRRKITYQLNVDGTTYSPQISLLANQLDYLETAIAKGKSQKAVLVFQVDKNAANASSIDLSIEEGDNKTSVKMK